MITYLHLKSYIGSTSINYIRSKIYLHTNFELYEYFLRKNNNVNMVLKTVAEPHDK